MKTLLLLLGVFFLTSAYSEETPVFHCKGLYDHYDDTCYRDDGSFTFYEFVDGAREVKKDKRFPGLFYYYWFGGYPYGYYPYYPYYYRLGPRYYGRYRRWRWSGGRRFSGRRFRRRY
jgi:hypothetical protein